jgi:DNA-binding transcriptional LysR family regulator
MTRVELRHLEHFVAVAEEQSFTRAARRVHLVQSGLSVSVRSLERELGTPLFERTTHRVTLTDAGEALLPEARRTLAAAEGARDAVAAVQGVVRGTLRVGIMQSLTVVDIASLFARFHRLYPGVDLRTRPSVGGSTAMAEELRRGQLEAAFVSLPGTPPPGLSMTPLASEPIVLIAALGRLPDGGRTMAISDLDGEAFVDFPPGWGTRAAAEATLAAAGVQRRVSVEVADVTTFVEFVGAGLGLGFLPRSMLGPHHRRLDIRTLQPSPHWEVALATPADHRPSAAARAFLELALPPP